MFGITTVDTRRVGAVPRCEACGAGATLWFNWSYAQGRDQPEDRARTSVFSIWRPLRRGQLYRCSVCQEVWHLDGNAETMTYVEEERLLLVLKWNNEPISIPTAIVADLELIGPTPPDTYGNGRERRVTPCTIETRSGEVFELAMVCVQPDAPVQSYLQFRLGSEIAKVGTSRFALPLEVRRESSRAPEMRMDFSPSLIEMPDGMRFVLNGMTNFMAVDGYDATEASVASGNYFNEDPRPTLLQTPEGVVYFIVDGDPGWVDPSQEAASPVQLVATPMHRRQRTWLQRLFRR